ncbi:MAG: MerR family transcriptional regulator [Lachnospiraceae bacterium]|nr:MerR family transcriptional regulator [Lachnospiraceae bacterium]
MSKEKNTLFTIGQFAAMYGINKKTLMFYDEIGLFKPAMIHKENGYRFYSYYQSTELETILLLREMKVSVSDIQDFMRHRSTESMESLLREKIVELDENIENLRAIREKLCDRHTNMRELLSLDPSRISVIEKEPHYLATVQTTPEKSFEEDVEAVIRQTREYHLPLMYQETYGSMISVKSLYAREFHDYSLLFIQLPNAQNKKGVHIQPGGKYLQAFCKGSWDRLPYRYEELLQYAEQNHIELSGYSYETGINEMVIDTMENYITKIEIPIREAKSSGA